MLLECENTETVRCDTAVSIKLNEAIDNTYRRCRCELMKQMTRVLANVCACVRACVWVKSSSSGYASSSPHCNYRDLSLARSSRQCNQHSAHRAQPGERRWIPRRQSVSPKLSVISLVQFSIRAATTTRLDETIRSSRDFNCRMRRSRRGRTGGRRRSSAGKRASVQASILLSSGARASHCRALVDRFAGGSRSVLSAVTNAVNRASSSK